MVPLDHQPHLGFPSTPPNLIKIGFSLVCRWREVVEVPFGPHCDVVENSADSKLLVTLRTGLDPLPGEVEHTVCMAAVASVDGFFGEEIAPRFKKLVNQWVAANNIVSCHDQVCYTTCHYGSRRERVDAACIFAVRRGKNVDGRIPVQKLQYLQNFVEGSREELRMKFMQIRNATIKVEYAGKTFLFDPFLADKGAVPGYPATVNSHINNPTVDLPMSMSEVFKDVDAVIVTHTHPDHWDDAAKKLVPKDMLIFARDGRDDGKSNCPGSATHARWRNATSLPALRSSRPLVSTAGARCWKE